MNQLVADFVGSLSSLLLLASVAVLWGIAAFFRGSAATRRVARGD